MGDDRHCEAGAFGDDERNLIHIRRTHHGHSLPGIQPALLTQVQSQIVGMRQDMRRPDSVDERLYELGARGVWRGANVDAHGSLGALDLGASHGARVSWRARTP